MSKINKFNTSVGTRVAVNKPAQFFNFLLRQRASYKELDTRL